MSKIMEHQSNLDALHRSKNGTLKMFEGAGLPIRYGSRLEQEINLLMNGCGLFDMKASFLIMLKGTDAAMFLQGMVTNDVLKHEKYNLLPALLCTNRGSILHKVEIIRLREDEWVVGCEPGEGPAVGQKLDQFHIREDFTMSLLNRKRIRIDLIGPHSKTSLEQLGFGCTPGLWDFSNQTVITIPCTLGILPRLVNLVPVESSQEFVEELLDQEHTGLAGLNGLDQVRTEFGIPRFGIDYGRDHFPQEASLGDHIAYDKGCYIGQETHARMYHRGHPNRQLVQVLVLEEIKIDVGTKLYVENEEAGYLTSISEIRNDGVRHGIAMIKYKLTADRVPLSAEPGEAGLIQQQPLPATIS